MCVGDQPSVADGLGPPVCDRPAVLRRNPLRGPVELLLCVAQAHARSQNRPELFGGARAARPRVRRESRGRPGCRPLPPHDDDGARRGAPHHPTRWGRSCGLRAQVDLGVGGAARRVAGRRLGHHGFVADRHRERVTPPRQTATLSSSVHIVCRPRERADGTLITDSIGEWRDVVRELPKRIREWLPRLSREGIVGADAIFSCLGPALELFSRFARVERANGQVVALKEYLVEVWAAVSKEALSMIFEDVDTIGFEPDARLTAMWLWTLTAAARPRPGEEDDSGPEVEPEDIDGPTKGPAAGSATEYDAARKIAQGLGANLEALSDVVEVRGDRARLLPVVERARLLFNRPGSAAVLPAATSKRKQLRLFESPDAEVIAQVSDLGHPIAGRTTLDKVHQAMLLFGQVSSDALKRFLVDDGAAQDPRFWKLAQSLSALYPDRQ